MSDALPVLFSVLHNVYRDKTSDQILSEIDEFDDPDASPEDLIDKLGSLGDFYDKKSVIRDLLEDDADIMKQFDPIRAELDDLLAAAEDPDIGEDLEPTIDEIVNLMFNGLSGMDAEEVNRLISEDANSALRHYGYYEDD